MKKKIKPVIKKTWKGWAVFIGTINKSLFYAEKKDAQERLKFFRSR